MGKGAEVGMGTYFVGSNDCRYAKKHCIMWNSRTEVGRHACVCADTYAAASVQKRTKATTIGGRIVQHGIKARGQEEV